MRIILVLGMHRSGTSVAARALESLGGRLGDRLMPAGPDNPKGFFEDVDIANINDRVLRRMNSTWQHLDVRRDNGLSSASALAADNLGAYARRALRKKVSGRLPLVLKDPRLCVLLPFWRPVLRELGLEVSALIVVRHPLSVADSLEHRNGINVSRSLDLWLQYMLAVLTDLEDHWPVAAVEYESIMSKPYEELKRVANALELTYSDDDVTAFASTFLDTGLNHAGQHSNSEPGSGDVRRLYSLLRGLAGGLLSVPDAKAETIAIKSALGAPNLIGNGEQNKARTWSVRTGSENAVLVHLATGIGNIVLATPLLQVLAATNFKVDVLLDADYAGVGELLSGWSAVRTVYDGRGERVNYHEYAHVLVAIPPFCWDAYEEAYRMSNIRVYRPSDVLFYRNEQAYYLEFARKLGCQITKPPYYFLPQPLWRGPRRGVVLAPGCKPDAMAVKRWPFFPELSKHFDDVAIVGTAKDLSRCDGSEMQFPGHVRSFIDDLTLRETAAIMASAKVVIANDSGLGHLAGALGVPTMLLFGPTPDRVLGPLPPNVTVMRTGLKCEPCWFSRRFKECDRRIDCLSQLSVDSVVSAVRAIQNSQKARA